MPMHEIVRLNNKEYGSFIRVAHTIDRELNTLNPISQEKVITAVVHHADHKRVDGRFAPRPTPGSFKPRSD